jgi:NADPH:quinone reductase-like Zn-dependent oxidoreductase
MADTTTMRAVVLDGYGPPGVLHPTTVPIPAPGRDEVLVAVHTATVNAIDWKTRAGQGVPVKDFPAVLGWDIAGTVTATGPGVTSPEPGDRVFGMLRFPELANGYAEYVVAPVADVAVLADGVEPPDAVGPMVALTAWDALFQQARLQSGQRVLVHGAAGGVGHVAVQLARWAGADVTGTGSARNHEFLRGLGAGSVVDYTTTPLETVATGMDVVLDTRGGEDFHRLLDTLRPGGVIVTLLGEQQGQVAAAQARGVRAGYTYVAPDGAVLGRIADLVRRRELMFHIDARYPLDGAAEAHAVGEGGHVRGLLTLDVS